MAVPELSRYSSQGVTLLGDTSRPGGVSFAFTERTGGVSEGRWGSLNLGSCCGDEPSHVEENRRRALFALGAIGVADRLLVPRQVHGDSLVCLDAGDDESLGRARLSCEEGADGVVCTAEGVPVLLCFADCLPVVLTCPGGFAVVHSGWKGSILGIAGKAARTLAAQAGCSTDEVSAYLGPHILGSEYEVSLELADRFRGRFGERVLAGARLLDLSEAVLASLEEAGVPASRALDSGLSTLSLPERFFSYRKERGRCGRHAAIAWLPSPGGKGGRNGRD